MTILEEDVQRVREATDIVAVISPRVQLRKVGTRWSGLCPFHSEKTPSFSVNSVEGFYHCFGCKASGDAITFVRETEQLDFVGAIEFLAAKAGIQLRYTDESESESRRRHKALMSLVERATEWYHERLLTGPDAGAARKYLRERGFDREMVDRYRLGWAPDGWDLMCKAIGLKAADAEAAGLGFVNKAGRIQDFFRGRVLFPISDDQGRPIAFGGRKLPGTEGPKYQNSRENELYHKSQTLYGLHLAKSDIVQAGQVVVCEGYTDVIGFHRAGIQRAVATCGTALTDEHLKILKRFTNRIVLAYDADQAGNAAASRVYAWEKSLSLEIGVVQLLSGQDPDELSRTDPEALADRVVHSRPFLAFRVDRALENCDVSTPESRLRSARPALAMVAEHPDAAVRRAYLSEIALRVRMDESMLVDVLEQERRQVMAGGTQSGSGFRSSSGGGSRRQSGSAGGPATASAGQASARQGSAVQGSAGRNDRDAFVGRSESPSDHGGYDAPDDDDPRWAEFSTTRPSSGATRSGRGGASQPRSGGRQTGVPSAPIPAERRALALIVDDPAERGWFDAVLFRHPDTYAVYEALCHHETAGDALVALNDSARELLVSLIGGAHVEGDVLGMGRPVEVPPGPQLRNELVLLVATSELQQLSRGHIPADELGRYAEVISSVANLVQQLRHAIGEDDEIAARDSADALLDWLIEQSEDQ